EVSGAAFLDGTAYMRIEGLGPQLAYRRDRLLQLFSARETEVLDTPATTDLWRGMRDLSHFAGQDAPLWRVLQRPTDAARVATALAALGGRLSVDWGGGLIWYAGPGEAAAIRAIAPHATLIRRGGATG